MVPRGTTRRTRFGTRPVAAPTSAALGPAGPYSGVGRDRRLGVAALSARVVGCVSRVVGWGVRGTANWAVGWIVDSAFAPIDRPQVRDVGRRDDLGSVGGVDDEPAGLVDVDRDPGDGLAGRQFHPHRAAERRR
jgi:hypothetical protein